MDSYSDDQNVRNRSVQQHYHKVSSIHFVSSRTASNHFLYHSSTYSSPTKMQYIALFLPHVSVFQTNLLSIECETWDKFWSSVHRLDGMKSMTSPNCWQKSWFLQHLLSVPVMQAVPLQSRFVFGSFRFITNHKWTTPISFSHLGEFKKIEKCLWISQWQNFLWTLPIIWMKHKWRFGGWFCLRSEVEGKGTYSVGPIGRSCSCLR